MLFGEIKIIVRLYQIGWLYCGHWAESPTWSTSSLILNWSNSSSLSPVYRCSDSVHFYVTISFSLIIIIVGRFDQCSIMIRWDSPEVCRDELLLRNPHELCLAFFVRWLWILVVPFDLLLMLFVDEGPKDILSILISFIKEFFPFEVFLIILVIFALAAHLSKHNAHQKDDNQWIVHCL